jgi:hypothetical protein
MDFLGHAKSTSTRQRECIPETVTVQIEMKAEITLGRFDDQDDLKDGYCTSELCAAKLGED